MSDIRRRHPNIQILNRANQRREVGRSSINADRYVPTLSSCSQPPRVKLEWKWSSGKCIDASPVILCNQEGRYPNLQSSQCDCLILLSMLCVLKSRDRAKSECVVCIGSHSGLVACLRALDGEVLWKQQLEDRVEATAGITPSGQLAIVGKFTLGSCASLLSASILVQAASMAPFIFCT